MSEEEPTQVTCECGAVYERRLITLALRDKDKQACSCCGRTLESWDDIRIPSFRLTSRPPSRAD